MQNLSYDFLHGLSEKYGDSFYLVDEEKYASNFSDLRSAFRKIYENSNIAFSYKTNYMPTICSVVNQLGGYSEVVSDLEYQAAKRIGVDDSRIIFNGPYKNYGDAENIILHNGHVNLDSETDFRFFRELVKRYPDRKLGIGIRCNFDVQDGILSRFGIDTESELFREVLSFIQSSDNAYLKNLHCHFAHRQLECWSNRAKIMLALTDRYHLTDIEQIDLGGGLSGRKPNNPEEHPDEMTPDYDDYAAAVAQQFSDRFGSRARKPELVIEPGGGLAGDVMKLVTKVTDIRRVRGKAIATLLGTFYNINPTLVFTFAEESQNVPMRVFRKDPSDPAVYEDLDFGGSTCIEFDYMNRHYNGPLAVGDYVVFDNAGAYSVVLKPPFIIPNFAVVSVTSKGVREVKRAETFEDIFRTYVYPDENICGKE